MSAYNFQARFAGPVASGEKNQTIRAKGKRRHANLERFARDDGFKSASEMREWFEKTHGLPFEGVLIKWERA